MAEKVLNTRIIHKHDTEENWRKAQNFIPKQGELIVYDIDATHDYERIKMGDGKTLVNNLPFISSGNGIVDNTLSISGAAADAKVTGDALASKLTEPSSGLAVGKYFRIAAIDENGHAVLEAVDAPVGGLSTDPILWPLWTSDEQEAARERMGIDKPYELIEEITLEEDVDEFIREYEPNGNAYCFRNVVICIIGTITSSVNIASLYNKNGENLCQLYRYGSIPGNSKVFYSADFLSGRLGKSSLTIASNGNGSVIETKTDYKMFDSDPSDITIAKIRLGYSIVSGSKIMIYGVRA